MIIDLKDSRAVEMSEGKTLHLRHLNEDCKLLCKNASSIIEVNVVEEPHYRVVIDKM